MKVLVLGGTRFFGVHLVNALLEAGHTVTVATRGTHSDPFGERVERLRLDRADSESLRAVLAGRRFDVACDNLAYCSEDVRILLAVLEADRYVVTSSGSVYNLHEGVREEEFDPYHTGFVWAGRNPAAYAEGKQAMECAVFQTCRIPAAAVRLPYVIGEDDYTRRLAWYVEHVAQSRPMQIDDPDVSLSFVRSQDAGAFLAWLCEQTVTGPVNGCNGGTVRLREILERTARKTGGQVKLTPEGDPAPYNGTPDYTLDTSRARDWGFAFPPLDSYLPALLDFYAEEASASPARKDSDTSTRL